MLDIDQIIVDRISSRGNAPNDVNEKFEYLDDK
jgi:hypothetical protein